MYDRYNNVHERVISPLRSCVAVSARRPRRG